METVCGSAGQGFWQHRAVYCQTIAGLPDAVGGGDDRANPGKNQRLGGWGEIPNEGLVKAG